LVRFFREANTIHNVQSKIQVGTVNYVTNMQSVQEYLMKSTCLYCCQASSYW